MAISTIERRRAALFAALTADGLGTLIADRSAYLASTAPAALIATLTQPFGAGTSFDVVGAPPAQLALASGGRIVAGAGAAAIGAKYEIKVRAASADGRRETIETLGFVALAAAPTPSVPAGAIINNQSGYLRNASGGYVLRSSM